MKEYLNKNLRLCKYSIFNSHLIREMKTSNNNLYMTESELQRLQWLKAKAMLKYAYSSCPYYHLKYTRAGLSPRDIRSLDDFRNLPILTKQEIRDNLDMLVPTDIESNTLEIVYTGGTTGVPMKIYRDKRRHDLMTALYLRTIRMWGCDIGSKTIWIWGIPDPQAKRDDFCYQSLLRRFFKNTVWFNAFNMTADRMREFSDFLNKFRPSLIIGYVSALYEYAKFIGKNHLRIFSPKAIWLTAEPFDSTQRQVIESVFKTNTFSQYGSSEILHIAAECNARSGLHIYADSRYVEIIGKSGTAVPIGNTGNIVVTDLENRVMPLIRYKNDDIGSLREAHCECGLHLPMMNYVKGRIYDMITLKNGRKIYGHMFSRVLFKYVTQIKQFQVHQTSLDKIVIRIVPGKLRCFKKLKAKIVAAFKEHTDDAIDYTFEIVGHIDRAKSGKLRYVKSDVL